MAKAKRAAIYLRVSTDDQTVENQRRELTAAATARGWTVVAEYADEGISGAKGRDGRPQLDLLLKDAVRRCFDVAMVWAVDRLGRSLPDLIAPMQELHDAKVDLFMLQQGIDTTTPGGKAMFQMLGVFGDDAECAVMQSDPTGIQESPGLRRRSAPHNLRPQRGLSVRAALPSWPVAVWTEAISTC